MRGMALISGQTRKYVMHLAGFILVVYFRAIAHSTQSLGSFDSSKPGESKLWKNVFVAGTLMNNSALNKSINLLNVRYNFALVFLIFYVTVFLLSLIHI